MVILVAVRMLEIQLNKIRMAVVVAVHVGMSLNQVFQWRSLFEIINSTRTT